MDELVFHQEAFPENIDYHLINKCTPELSLSAGWQTVSLEKVVKIFDKDRKPLNELQRQNMQGSYPYCGANGILDYVNDYLFNGEYILLAEDGGYWGSFENSAYIMHEKFWVNNHAHILQAIPCMADNCFIVHQLNYLDLDRFISGTTRGKLTQGILQKISILLPPLPEQRAIAHTLQTAQNAIQTRHRELELERERKAALMQHLFTYGTRGEATRETEIGKMPQSWKISTVGDISTLQRGFDITRKDQNPGKVPVISSSGILSYHDTAMVKGPGVIIGRKGSLGTAFYVEDDYWPHDTTLWVKDFHENYPKFIYYFLKNLNIGHLDVGSSNPTLNRNHLHAIRVGLPTLSEQHEIADICSLCDAKIAAIEKEIALYEEFFRTLLEELMSGRLSALPLVES